MFKRYKSAKEFHEYILSLIEARNFDYALLAIRDYVDGIISEPLCVSLISASRELDCLCQLIGSLTLDSGLFKNQNSSEVDGGSYVYVITKFPKSGGHARVIEQFIKSRPNARHIVLATGMEGKSDTDYFYEAFKEYDANLEISSSKSPYATLIWLQKRLLSINADNNYLFNHHQDSVIIAAVQPSMLKKVTFYHHGDHHLCLGVTVSHFEHIDFHPMGFHHCRNSLGIDNVYYPLVTNKPEISIDEQTFMNNGFLVTCTAARSNKIEQPYYVSYLDIVSEILSETKGRHIHIGKLSVIARLKIKLSMLRRGVPLERFIYIPWVPSIAFALRKYKVDLYIASFPYGAALTQIEAMSVGTPTILHKHMYSRVLSCIDLGYPGVFYWEKKSELINFLRNISVNWLSAQSEAAIRCYLENHTPELLTNILNGGENVISPPYSVREFHPDLDEYALWICNQRTLTGVISQKLFQLIKKLRSRYH